VNFNYLFFAFFAVVAGSMVYQILRNRGFRGAMFGAPLRSTLAEIQLERRGMVKSRVKVHQLDGHTKGIDVGLEIVHSTIGSWHVVPVSLSAADARRLSEVLDLAARKAESPAAAG
jgi:hypothetical protein